MNFLPDPGSQAASGAPEPFARLTVERFIPGNHVVELLSLLPFHAAVQTDRPALLETPKVFIPGYRAYVNGKDIPVLKSGEGLVGVPLDIGRSDVVVDYPGSPMLRLAYFVSAGAWLALGLCVGATLALDSSRDRVTGGLARDHVLPRALHLFPILALAALLLAIFAIWVRLHASPKREGALKMVVRLPIGGAHKNEPLVTTGKTGAGDVIYIRYLGGSRISVCHDRWGNSGVESQPFAVNFMDPQVIEISMRSLGDLGDTRPGLSVKWNGREVLNDDSGSYPPGPEKTEIGANLIGASTCVPEFSGMITQSVPIEPWTH
jgi:hypothetical protein